MFSYFGSTPAPTPTFFGTQQVANFFGAGDVSQRAKSYKPAIFFILGNELCERFNYYGLRTVLAIYLKSKLGFSENTATMTYHVFLMLSYFFPLFGAILADSYIGKFHTIFYVSLLYAAGTIMLSVASSLDLGVRGILSLMGLVIIAIGTGGIKPCVVAFGGNQFSLPDQKKQLDRFFSFFYFSINAGSMISTYATPILKQSVSCSDDGTCYPLAFGVPALLMVIATVIFVLGKPWYTIEKPQGHVFSKFLKCIGHAVRNKWHRNKEEAKKDHWLDYSDDTYDQEFIDDCKQALSVLKIFLPLPLFWALYDQQGSRWTFQAQAMYGGFFDDAYVLEPEQMQVFNPLLVLVFIPIFQFVVYPLFAKCNMLKKPLQRLITGGFLAALAFLVSALVELGVEPTYAIIPEDGKAQLRLFNTLKCPIVINAHLPCTSLEDSFVWADLDQNDIWQLRDIALEGSRNVTLNITGECIPAPKSIDVDIQEKAAKMYIIDEVFLDGGLPPVPVDAFNELDKSDNAMPKLGVLHSVGNTTVTLILKDKNGIETEVVLNGGNNSRSNDFKLLKASTYQLSIKGGDKLPHNIELKSGGLYILAYENKENYRLVAIEHPNTFHLMWQMPQIIIITVAEIMFSITGLELAFTQAPESMQSVMQSAWLLTTAVGSAIVAIISKTRLLDRQIHEFLLFAALMAVDMFIMISIAVKYNYVGTETTS